jgi:hypothetical protein
VGCGEREGWWGRESVCESVRGGERKTKRRGRDIEGEGGEGEREGG